MPASVACSTRLSTVRGLLIDPAEDEIDAGDDQGEGDRGDGQPHGFRPWNTDTVVPEPKGHGA